MTKSMTTLEPLVKAVTVPLGSEQAFDLFTTRIGEWWPLATHSVALDRAVSAHVETYVGGRLYEIAEDGTEHEWGRITEYVAGTSIAFSWYPGLDEGESTHVSVRFNAVADGTEVTVTHIGWEARGNQAAAMRTQYDTGWDYVLGKYTDAS